MNNSNSQHAGSHDYGRPSAFSAQQSQPDAQTNANPRPLHEQISLLHNNSSTDAATMKGNIGERSSVTQSSGRYRFQMPSPTAIFPKQFIETDKTRSVSVALMRPTILSGHSSATNSGLYHMTSGEAPGVSYPQSSLPTIQTESQRSTIPSQTKSRERKKRSKHEKRHRDEKRGKHRDGREKRGEKKRMHKKHPTVNDDYTDKSMAKSGYTAGQSSNLVLSASDTCTPTNSYLVSSKSSSVQRFISQRPLASGHQLPADAASMLSSYNVSQGQSSHFENMQQNQPTSSQAVRNFVQQNFEAMPHRRDETSGSYTHAKMPPSKLQPSLRPSMDAQQPLSACQTQPHLVSDPTGQARFAQLSHNANTASRNGADMSKSAASLVQLNARMAEQEQAFNEKLQHQMQTSTQIKNQVYLQTQQFSQGVESAVQSVTSQTRKTQIGNFDSLQHRTGESAIVVGGHLIDQKQLHSSITDPDIQTGSEQLIGSRRLPTESSAERSQPGRRRHKKERRHGEKHGQGRSPHDVQILQADYERQQSQDDPRPRSQAAQRYLNYIDRTFQRPSSRTLKNMLDTRQPARASSEQGLKKNRSIENVKVYCLERMKGTLNTKKEFERVNKVYLRKQEAQEVIKQRYDDARRRGVNQHRPESHQGQFEGTRASRHAPKPPLQQSSRRTQNEMLNTHDMNLFNEQFAQTYDERHAADPRDQRDPRRHGGDSQRFGEKHSQSSSVPCSTHSARAHHEYLPRSNPIALYRPDTTNPTNPSNRSASAQDQHQQSFPQAPSGEYYTLGRKEFSVQNLLEQPGQQPYRGEPERREHQDSKFEMKEIEDDRFDHMTREEQMKYLIRRSSKYIGEGSIESPMKIRQSYNQDDQESARITTNRSEVEHFNAHQIAMIKQNQKQIQQVTEIENVRVSALKKQAYEISQIIEDGHLANASSTKGADVLSHSRFSLPKDTQPDSNRKSVNDYSDFVQQHDVTSSFLKHEERYAGASRNQALERDHIREETIVDYSVSSTNGPCNMTGTLANFEMRAQIPPAGQDDPFSNRTQLSEFEICQKAPLAGVRGVSDKEAKKEHRKQKKEAKLRKLAKLEQMVQGSMSRITSCLTSHGSTPFREPQGREDLKASSIISDYTGIGDAHNAGRLSSTRKELKTLIKIQQKHGKLLAKLQQSGAVRPEAAPGESQLNAALLSQMQNVFKQLSQIQKRLDREATEETQRQQAMQPYITTSYVGQYPNPNTLSSPFAQQRQSEPLVLRTVLNPQQLISTGSVASNDAGQQLIHTAAKGQPNVFGSYQDSTAMENGNAVRGPSEGTNSTLFWETVGGTQNSNHSELLQARANQQYFQHEPTEWKQPQANIIVTDCDRQVTAVDETEEVLAPRSAPGTIDHSKQASTITGQSVEPFNSIKADAFCEILGQEIDRVRNESVQQVNEMRRQYDMELQALRQEFSLAAGHSRATRETSVEAADNKRSAEHMPETVTTPKTSTQSGDAHEAQVTMTEVNEFGEAPRDVFDELKHVRAERDLYYDKLLRVRARVQVAGTTTDRLETFKSQMQERARDRSQANGGKAPGTLSVLERSKSSKSPMLLSYGDISSPSVILRQKAEPEPTSSKGSKQVSIRITPVQALHGHNDTRVSSIEENHGSRSSAHDFQPRERMAQTHGPYQNTAEVTQLQARTLLDSSSLPSGSAGATHAEFSATLGKRSGQVAKVNQTRTSIMRKNVSRDTRGDVQRCTSCLSSMPSMMEKHSRSGSYSSLSGSRRAVSFPPAPRSNGRECMSCLKNFVAQKKAMIEVKAQQFLERPTPTPTNNHSPFMGQGRKMTTIERSNSGNRSSMKGTSAYQSMEQTGGMMADSLNMGSATFAKYLERGRTNQEEKQGGLSQREKEIEERIHRIEFFLKQQQAL